MRKKAKHVRDKEDFKTSLHGTFWMTTPNALELITIEGDRQLLPDQLSNMRIATMSSVDKNSAMKGKRKREHDEKQQQLENLKNTASETRHQRGALDFTRALKDLKALMPFLSSEDQQWLNEHIFENTSSIQDGDDSKCYEED